MFCVCKDVCFEISALSEALATKVKGTVVGSISRVDPDVGSQVEIQGESLATPFKRTLKY